MPLSKHKLDNTRIFVLSIKECDHPDDIGATADFAYLDPFTQETKISSATLKSWRGRVSQQPLHTAVKFDGEKVWGAMASAAGSLTSSRTFGVRVAWKARRKRPTAIFVSGSW